MSYICSRYYRAPELIFGATDYTSSIGMCVHLLKSVPTASLFILYLGVKVSRDLKYNPQGLNFVVNY